MAQGISSERCAVTAAYSNCYPANEPSLFLSPVDEKEIASYIQPIKPNCAPGHDGLDGNLLKYTAKHITKPLVSAIFHHTLKNG